jgi:hypothetical protein
MKIFTPNVCIIIIAAFFILVDYSFVKKLFPVSLGEVALCNITGIGFIGIFEEISSSMKNKQKEEE